MKTQIRATRKISLALLLIGMAALAGAQDAPRCPESETDADAAVYSVASCRTCSSASWCKRSSRGGDCDAACPAYGQCVCQSNNRCEAGVDIPNDPPAMVGEDPHDPLNPGSDVRPTEADRVVLDQITAYFASHVAPSLRACWPRAAQSMTLWFHHHYRRDAAGTWTYVSSAVPFTNAPAEVKAAAERCMAAAELNGRFTLEGDTAKDSERVLKWPWRVWGGTR
jgi:hypothetical protein